MICVQNDLIKDERLTYDAVMTYVFLQALTYSPNYESVTFTITQLADQMFYPEPVTHTVHNRIARAFKLLLDNNYLVVTKENSSSWRMWMDTYSEPSNGYTLVDMNEIRKITRDAKIKNKAVLVNYYLLVLSTIMSKTKVGVYERIWFANMLGISEQTVTRYNRILEDKEMIYFCRSSDMKTSNTYGRYEDSEFVEMEGQKRTRGFKSREDANEKRRCVMIYRSVCAGSDDYDLETLRKVLHVMQDRETKNTRGQVYDLQPLLDKINSKGV